MLYRSRLKFKLICFFFEYKRNNCDFKLKKIKVKQKDANKMNITIKINKIYF